MSNKDSELQAEIERLKSELSTANGKWMYQEQEYILPVFDLMTEAGFDLRELVSENAGTNCVILAIKKLCSEIECLKNENAQMSTVLDYARRACHWTGSEAMIVMSIKRELERFDNEKLVRDP